MAVTPEFKQGGNWSWFEWILTSADQDAVPTPPIGHRNDKTVDLNEIAAGGFGTGTVQIHGDLQESGPGFFKLMNTIPDTTQLSFTANTPEQYLILPNVHRVKPVVTAGTLSADGVRITLLVTSGRELST